MCKIEHLIFIIDKDNLIFKYDGMEKQESIQSYFNIAFDDIKNKEGSDSIFIIDGNVEQKLDLDDEWKVTEQKQ